MSFAIHNPVESLAQAVYSALSNPEYLPDLEYYRPKAGSPIIKGEEREQVLHKRRPSGGEVMVYHFPQTWGSTALGFGGIGGQAFTSAMTTVIISQNDTAAVFFNGKHAYTIKDFNETFEQDVHRCTMKECRFSSEYETKPNDSETAS